jgi:hypothetical protein
MTWAVYKFPFAIDDRVVIPMPPRARILSVQVQHGVPCLWALVDFAVLEAQPYAFRIYGTGHPVDNAGEYIGTFQMNGGDLVFHMFREAV